MISRLQFFSVPLAVEIIARVTRVCVVRFLALGLFCLLFLAFKIILMVVVVVVFAFLLISFLFSLMKSKQTAVRGPTGGGRPPVTGFY